jgi:inorganic pyrophosphatase
VRTILNITVEVPKGSRNKYEYDPAIGAIKLDRFLSSSMVYPVDYGFVRDTWGADEDPLDAMVLVSEPTFPGCVIPAVPIGLFRMSDEHGLDDKLLCVPAGDPNWNHITALEQVPDQILGEITHFFSVYKQPEGKHVDVDGWHPLQQALDVLAAARDRWKERVADAE